MLLIITQYNIGWRFFGIAFFGEILLFIETLVIIEDRPYRVSHWWEVSFVTQVSQNGSEDAETAESSASNVLNKSGC